MTEPRFCDQCGKSLVPLAIPHVKRACNQCPKSFHIAEPGDEGKGVKVEQGDKFIIPSGWLTMSLDPHRTRGRFARHGIKWFVQQLIFSGVPRELDGLAELLDRWENEADEVLRTSDKLTGLDIDDEKDGERIVEILQKDKDSVEFWAMVTGGMARRAREQLQDGEPAAALSALQAANARALLIYIRDLDKYVWTGYRHTTHIYDIATAASQTPAQAEAIETMRPIFEKLNEATLRAWLESSGPIGPRIGITNVEEDVIRGLARYHLDEFERKRQKDELDRQHSSRKWTVLVGAFSAGAAIMGAVFAALTSLGVL